MKLPPQSIINEHLRLKGKLKVCFIAYDGHKDNYFVSCIPLNWYNSLYILKIEL